MTIWTRNKDAFGDFEYVHCTGARVYHYGKKPYATEWGVQLASDKIGSGGFRSMKEAKQFVEKFSK